MTDGQDPRQESAPSGLDALLRVMASVERGVRAVQEWCRENEGSIRVVQERILAGIAHLAWSIEDLRSLPGDLSALVDEQDPTNFIRNGWYPSVDTSLASFKMLANHFNPDDEEADPEGANEAMCAIFREELNDIETRLASEFPHRSEILRDAFQAHRHAQYNLSIPVFLVQAEGIWRDRCSRSPYSSRDTTAIREFSEQGLNSLARKLVQALLDTESPLALSEDKRPSDFAELNRHQVLHGVVTRYGTELNSLKALSFLNFSAFVLSEPATTANIPARAPVPSLAAASAAEQPTSQ